MELKNLVCGKYKLKVAARGHHEESFQFDVTTKGFEKSLTLKTANGTVKGRLVDKSTGKPLGGMQVLVSNEYPESNWETKHDFMYTYLITAPDGSFTASELSGTGSNRHLVVDLPDFLLLEKHWIARVNDENLGDLILSRAGSVHGTLTAGGVPASGHEVQIWTPADPVKLTVSGLKTDFHGYETSGAGGLWKRPKLKPGTYLLRTGFAAKVVEVKAGEDTDAGTSEIEQK